MSSWMDDLQEEDHERSVKFTREYDSLTDIQKEALKGEIHLAPCNIWGYMRELELRVKTLEDKVQKLENP